MELTRHGTRSVHVTLFPRVGKNKIGKSRTFTVREVDIDHLFDILIEAVQEAKRRGL